MITTFRAILLTTVFGLAPACGSSTGTSTSSSAEGTGSGSLLVENETTSAGIVERLLLKRGFAEHAYDVDVKLAPGDSHQYTDMTGGFYDLQVDWEGGTMDEFMDLWVRDDWTTDVTVSR